MLTACIRGQGFSQQWRSGLLDANDLEELDVNVGITEPCLPPCWQGLIPDESTTEEVMEVLNRVDSIDTSSIEYFSSDDDSMVDINWKSSLSDNPLHGGRLEITEGVLIFVEIVLEYELTVQEVIDRLGEPKLFTFLRGAESTDLAVRFSMARTRFCRRAARISSQNYDFTRYVCNENCLFCARERRDKLYGRKKQL